MSASTYKQQILPLKDKLVRLTDNFLHTSETEINNILNEITQEINDNQHDAGLIDVVPDTSNKSTKDTHRGKLFVDYECIPSKMDEFNQLLNSLIILYLEQESIDHFLRFTITTNKYLKIESIKDPEYRNLDNQLKILKEDQIDDKFNQLNQIKQEISNESSKIAKLEKDIKEKGLGVTNDIDECLELLKELETLQELDAVDKDNERDNDEIEFENLKQVKLEHDEIEKLTKERLFFEKKLNSIPIKNYINDTDGTNVKEQAQIENETLQKLITIYKNPILTNFHDKIEHLKFDYNNKQIKFSIGDQFENVIYLTNDNKFAKVEIFTDKVKRHSEFENFLKEKYYKHPNIFNIINIIKNKQLSNT